jgi:hypothetical protein
MAPDTKLRPEPVISQEDQRGTTPNPADVEDGLDQVGNLESALEPMPTFTSVNPAPCWVGSPRSGFYRSKSNQANQKRHANTDLQRSVAGEM